MHFITMAIVPLGVWKKGEEEIRTYIDNLMAPYSESLEVEPYVDVPAEEVEKDYEKTMKEAKNLTEVELKDRKYMKVYHDNPKMSLKEWAESWHGQQIDDGGNILSTFNPNSFWDWYRVGGRWDGRLTGNEQNSEDGFNFAKIHETLKNNSMPAKELLAGYKKDTENRRKFREATKIIHDDMVDDYPFTQIGLVQDFNNYKKKFPDHSKEFDEPRWTELFETLNKSIAEQIRDFDFYLKSECHEVIDEDGHHKADGFGWWGAGGDVKKLEVWEKTYIKLLEKAGEGYVVYLDCHV